MKEQTLRIGVALVVLQKLRESIESAGLGHKVGMMVPNMTSVSDVLTLPEKFFLQQLACNPQLRPTDEQLGELEAMWSTVGVELPGVQPPTLGALDE